MRNEMHLSQDASPQVRQLFHIIHENHGKCVLSLSGGQVVPELALPLVEIRQCGIDLEMIDFDAERCQQHLDICQKAADPFVAAMSCQSVTDANWAATLGSRRVDLVLLQVSSRFLLSLDWNNPGQEEGLATALANLNRLLDGVFKALAPGGSVLVHGMVGDSDGSIRSESVGDLLRQNHFNGICQVPFATQKVFLARRPLEGALDDNKQSYYRHQNQIMREVWSGNGSMCWGHFPPGQEESISLEAATDLHVQRMAERIGLTEESVLLDVGCGNGYTALWLAETYQCRVVGLDLSTTNIEQAEAALAKASPELKKRVSFLCASMVEAEFAAESFTHIWSNAAIYHVHAREMQPLFEKLSQVLKPGGVMSFDTLISPRGEVDDHVREWVCDRFHLETLHLQEAYQTAMEQNGLVIDNWEDLTQHLHITYKRVGQQANKANYPRLATAYAESAKTTERGTLGWVLVLARKEAV
ncbi:MAG: methyltransferase domain-containing protein [Magnetococcales bacterium]|nr:methyltransferase domain-containing protein [Magnetococcales bacterium]